MRPDSLLRLWRYINHLLTYLLTYLLTFGEGRFGGSEPPVRNDAAYRQITLALVSAKPGQQ